MDIFIIAIGIISLVASLTPFLGTIPIIPAIIIVIIGGIQLIKGSKNKNIVIGFVASILAIILTIIYQVIFYYDRADLTLNVILVSCIVVLVLGIVANYKTNPIRNLDKLKKEVILQYPISIKPISGLDGYQDVVCTLSFTNRNIVIKMIKDKKVFEKYAIRNEKVLAVEKEIANSKEKNLNVMKIRYIDSAEEKEILLSCKDRNDYKRFIRLYNQYILKNSISKIEDKN